MKAFFGAKVSSTKSFYVLKFTAVCRLVTGSSNNQVVQDTVFVGFNTSDTRAIATSDHCNFFNSDNNDVKTVHFKNITFVDTNKFVSWQIPQKTIFRDVDGSLTGQRPGTSLTVPLGIRVLLVNVILDTFHTW